MHNSPISHTPVEIPPYPTATQEDIEYLISFLYIMHDEEHPHKYVVAELYTDNNGEQPIKCYELKNITMVLENGILITSDTENKLWNEKHCLHTIIQEDLDYISYHNETNEISLTIQRENVYGIFIRIFY